MSFQIHQATRESVKALIGLYAKSSGGKTHSALLLMRGLVGPKGRIVVIDTENRRSGILSDLIPGGFGVIDLDPPFTAERYWDALEVAQENSDGIVIDSFSHVWAGEGGLLDQHEAELKRMAGDDWKKRESCKMTAWIRPKQAHKRLVERILRLKHPLVVCMRGEEKTHIIKEGAVLYREKGEEDPLLYPAREKGGKTKVVTDTFSSPIGDPRFIFEMLINMECIARENSQGQMVGGYTRITKCSHPQIFPLLPKPDEQVSISHGSALAAWCAGIPTAKPATDPVKDAIKYMDNSAALKKLKSQLWDMTKSIHMQVPAKLEQWLHDELFIQDDESLATLTEKRLAAVIESINHKLTTK